MSKINRHSERDSDVTICSVCLLFTSCLHLPGIAHDQSKPVAGM